METLRRSCITDHFFVCFCVPPISASIPRGRMCTAGSYRLRINNFETCLFNGDGWELVNNQKKVGAKKNPSRSERILRKYWKEWSVLAHNMATCSSASIVCECNVHSRYSCCFFFVSVGDRRIQERISIYTFAYVRIRANGNGKIFRVNFFTDFVRPVSVPNTYLSDNSVRVFFLINFNDISMPFARSISFRNSMYPFEWNECSTRQCSISNWTAMSTPQTIIVFVTHAYTATSSFSRFHFPFSFGRAPMATASLQVFSHSLSRVIRSLPIFNSVAHSEKMSPMRILKCLCGTLFFVRTASSLVIDIRRRKENFDTEVNSFPDVQSETKTFICHEHTRTMREFILSAVWSCSDVHVMLHGRNSVWKQMNRIAISNFGANINENKKWGNIIQGGKSTHPWKQWKSICCAIEWTRRKRWQGHVDVCVYSYIMISNTGTVFHIRKNLDDWLYLSIPLAIWYIRAHELRAFWLIEAVFEMIHIGEIK